MNQSIAIAVSSRAPRDEDGEDCVYITAKQLGSATKLFEFSVNRGELGNALNMGAPRQTILGAQLRELQSI